MAPHSEYVGSPVSRNLLNVQISRGIAATMVLLAHANLLIDKNLFHGWFIEGWCGVDFFFVLSGFIIFYANHADIGESRKLPLYLYKRFARVFPIYWLYTLAALAVNFAGVLLLKKLLIGWIALTPGNILRCFTLYPTDVAANVMPIIPVAWTLSYEVVFYLMFAVLIALRPKYARPIFGLWALLSVISLFFPIHFHNLLLSLLISRKNLEFLFGASIALAVYRFRSMPSKLYLQGTLGIGLVVLMCSWINAHMHYRYLVVDQVVSFGIAFALIVLSLVGLELSGKRNENASKMKLFFVSLGNASYSIYLVHFILIGILNFYLQKIGIHQSFAKFLVISTTCLGTGCLAYILVERPLLRALNQRYQSHFINKSFGSPPGGVPPVRCSAV